MKDYEELGVFIEGHYTVKYRGFELSCQLYSRDSNWYCTYGRRYLVKNKDGVLKLFKGGSDKYPILSLPQDELIVMIDQILENHPEIFV